MVGVPEMSLLNNMLNGLEKRQAGVETEQPDNPHGYNYHLSSNKRSGHFRSVVLLVVGVVAGFGALAWFNYQKTGTPPVMKETAAPDPSKAQPAPVEPVVISKTAISPPSAVSVTQDVTKTLAMTLDTLTAKKTEMMPVVSANKDRKMVTGLATTPDQGRPLPVQPPSLKVMRPQQRSDNFYRLAVSLMQQSRNTEAQHALRQALGANPANHSARQLLAELLIDTGGNAEAAALLRNGLELAPDHSGFSMVLAHLQFANGTPKEAIATLEKGLPDAGDDAEYHAFLAALLQKQGRHAEAVKHYILSLRSNPTMPAWLIGAGISLQEEHKFDDAAEAFQRAIDTGELSVEVAQFANQRLKQIRLQR